MRRQLLRQTRLGTDLGEALVDVGDRDPRAALGHEQRRIARTAEPRPNLGHVLLDHLHRPVKHRQHRAPLRPAAALALAMTHVRLAIRSELRQPM
jgi:hypothetical protein